MKEPKRVIRSRSISPKPPQSKTPPVIDLMGDGFSNNASAVEDLNNPDSDEVESSGHVGITLDESNAVGKSEEVAAAIRSRVSDMKSKQAEAVENLRKQEQQVSAHTRQERGGITPLVDVFSLGELDLVSKEIADVLNSVLDHR